jgi:hypothetical protein
MAPLGLAMRNAPRQGRLIRSQGTSAKDDRVLELDLETLLVQHGRLEAGEGRIAQSSSCSIAALFEMVGGRPRLF